MLLKEREENTMEKFMFSNDEAKKMYEEKMNSLRKIVNENMDDRAYLWDETVKKYAVKMAKVNKILQSEGINEQVLHLSKEINTFLSKCSSAEFHIALVGAIKAGKSTLINALLGYKYASTEVTPETAVLTKFRKSSEDYVKVSFYTNAEWDKLWKSVQETKASVFMEEYNTLGAENEKSNWLNKDEEKDICNSKEEVADMLLGWTSSKSAKHYFVREVEVGLKDFELPEGIVLVDTPGLDDVVQYRSDITRRYIDRANAVLVCVKADALTGQEWGTICRVFTNAGSTPEKVYIIATQTDTLNRPIENWEKQRKEWIKYLKSKSAYGREELAGKNLISVSAYLYLLLNDYNTLKEDDDEYWELSSILGKFKIKVEDIGKRESYDHMRDFTKIEFLRGELYEKFSRDYKKLLIDDIKESYLLCKDSIRKTMEDIRKNQQEIIQTSQCSLEEIQKKQREYEEKCSEAEKDKKELDTLLKQLQKITNQRTKELVDAIKRLE